MKIQQTLKKGCSGHGGLKLATIVWSGSHLTRDAFLQENASVKKKKKTADEYSSSQMCVRWDGLSYAMKYGGSLFWLRNAIDFQ